MYLTPNCHLLFTQVLTLASSSKLKCTLSFFFLTVRVNAAPQENMQAADRKDGGRLEARTSSFYDVIVLISAS